MKKITIDIQDKEITQIGTQTTIDFYRNLAIDEKNFFQASAFVTGLDSADFNVVFDNRLQKTNSTELVNSVDKFFNSHQVCWTWIIMPTSYEHDLLDQGFILTEESSGMYFNLLNKIPKMKSNFITIEEVKQNDDLRIWIQPINEGFEEEDEGYRKRNADILNSGNQKLRHFIAYYHHKVAASATLFLSNDAVMILNLATKTNFKHKGIGTTLAIHMMNLAQKAGFKHCYLEPSDEAFSLYRKIGFKVYCTILYYEQN